MVMVFRAQAVLSIANSLDAIIVVYASYRSVRHDLVYISLPGVLGELIELYLPVLRYIFAFSIGV